MFSIFPSESDNPNSFYSLIELKTKGHQMNQEVFPEIQAATEAIEKRIALTEVELAEMKEGIKRRKALLRSWRKALSAFGSKRAAPKKRTTGKQAASAA
jgi:hypothetical protein